MVDYDQVCGDGVLYRNGQCVEDDTLLFGGKGTKVSAQKLKSR